MLNVNLAGKEVSIELQHLLVERLKPRPLITQSNENNNTTRERVIGTCKCRQIQLAQH